MGLRWAATGSAAGQMARALGLSGEQKLDSKVVEWLSVRDTESGGPKMCEFIRLQEKRSLGTPTPGSEVRGAGGSLALPIVT